MDREIVPLKLVEYLERNDLIVVTKKEWTGLKDANRLLVQQLKREKKLNVPRD